MGERTPRSRPERSQDTRGYAAAEFSGPCLQPPPRGRVYSTPRCIILTTHNPERETAAGAQSSTAAIPRNFKGFRRFPQQERACLRGNQVETAIWHQWVEYAHLDNSTKKKENTHVNKIK